MDIKEKFVKRERRKKRVRKKIFGTSVQPRLSVHRTLLHIYAQIIDDELHKTLVQSASTEKEQVEKMTKTEMAKKIGALIAKRAIEKGIKKVVFDRGWYLYHGRVKALAESAREAGLEF